MWDDSEDRNEHTPPRARDLVFGTIAIISLSLAMVYIYFNPAEPIQIDTKQYKYCSDINEEMVLHECYQYLQAKETYEQLKPKWGHIQVAQND